MKYILCCMRAEGKIDVMFVFTSTKKNNFYDDMVDTNFVMHYETGGGGVLTSRGSIGSLCLISCSLLCQAQSWDGQLVAGYCQVMECN